MPGPTTPDLRLDDPPVCCHGFRPNLAEMAAVAFRDENVYVSPDMYTVARREGCTWRPPRAS